MFIETGTIVPFDLEGESIPIKVLTARQRLKVMRVADTISDMVKGYGEDEVMPVAVGINALDEQFGILVMGIDLPEEKIDAIPPEHWPTLAQEIIRVNGLTETDAEN